MIENMNMTDAIISITGIQHDASGQRDEVNLITAGQYGFEDGRVCFTYEESDLTGLDGTQTTFSVSPMGVVLRREGSTVSEMIFEQGKKHFILCETPFGSAALGVDTRRVKSSLGEHGGDMELDYNVDLNNTPVGRNHFKINVKESKHGRPN
ncbi:MAG: DUF1934 domain-containing protein [Oscillospiraceae bacterium]|nr:DUF1934 domain-containing protein [Oscillospiraceae bacterium]